MAIEISSLRSVLALDTTQFKASLAESVTAMKAATTETQKMAAGLAAHLKVEAEAAAAAARSATVKRQEVALDRELTAARAKLSEMLAGEDKLVVAVSARYSALSNARRAELVEVKQQIAAEQELAAATVRAASEAQAAQERAAAAHIASLKGIEAAELRSLEVRRLNQVEAQKKLTDARQNVGKNLSTLGGAITGAVTTPILGVGAAAIGSALDIQGGDAQVAARSGAAGQQLAALEQAMRRVAATVPQTFAAVGGAIGDLFARTHDTGAALEGLAKAELDLQRITGGDLQETIKKTTQVFAAWGVTVADQIPTLDMLEKAHQLTGVKVTELADALSRSAPTLKAWGLSITDSTALLAGFEKANISPQRAVQGLTTGISNLAKKGVTDLHAALGQIIHDLGDTSDKSKALAAASNLFGARFGTVLVEKIRDGTFSLAAFKQQLAESSGAIAKTGEAAQTFGTRFKTELHAAEVALEPLGVELLKLGTEILKDLEPVIKKVAELTGWFGRLSPAGKDTTVVVLALAAAFGPGVVAIGKWVTALAELKEAWLALTLVLKGSEGYVAITAGLEALAAAPLAVVAPWVLAFGAMAAAVAYLVTHLDDAKLGVSVLGNLVNNWSHGQFRNSLNDAEEQAVQQQRMAGVPIVENRGSLNRRPAAPAQPVASPGSSLADRARIAAAEAGRSSTADALKREQTAYTEAMAEAHGRLTAALSSEDKIAEQVAAKYHLLTQSQRDNLVAVLEQVEAAEQVRKANDKISENSRVITLLKKGESVAVAESAAQYDHLSVGQLRNLDASNKALEAAKKATESHKTYTVELAKTNAEIRRLAAGHAAEGGAIDALKERLPGLTQAQYQAIAAADQWKLHLEKVREAAIHVADAIRGVKERLLETQATTKVGEAAVTLFGKDFLKKYKGASAQRLWANLTDQQRDEARDYAGVNEETDIGAAIKAARQDIGIKNYRSRTSQLTQTYFPGQQDTLSQDQQKQIATLERLLHTQTQVNAADAVYQAQTQRTDTLIGGAQAQLGELTDQYEALTGHSQAARDVLAQFGVVLKDLPEDAQRSVREILKMQQGLDFLHQFATGVQNVFQNMFSNLFDHGFKGFFQNVIHGFEQMLQQMAAQYLSSQLSGLFMNLLGGALGAVSGGKVDSGAYRQGFASGGDVYAGVPITVGEGGSETFVPRTNGTILPHGAAVQGAGITIHQSFVIQTPNPQAFRQSQGQLLADANRAALLAARRGS